MKQLMLSVLLIFLFANVKGENLTGTAAPDFSATDTQGRELSLSDYRGKVVLLDFWASWCAPCKEEFPFLVEFYQEYYKEDFIVLAVNIDNEQKNMERFIREIYAKTYTSHKFPIIFDKDKKIPPLYNLEAMPSSIFIDKKGIVRYVHTGFNDSRKKEFRKELADLLHEKE
jgi:thiol-disulfide isomerase/thioredoxin